ncbi:MAG: hypothetical protein ACYC7L_18125 [Nitrospirota bacterium]
MSARPSDRSDKTAASRSKAGQDDLAQKLALAEQKLALLSQKLETRDKELSAIYRLSETIGS